jgi:phosphoglycerate dehydrogenase-like enzyme
MQTRLIVIDPLWKNLCTTEQQQLLLESGVLVEIYYTWSKHVIDIVNSSYFDDNILYLNPDVFDWSIDAEELNKVERCQRVITGSTSYSWISNSDKLDAVLQNIPDFSTDAVTDWCLMMVFSLIRKVPLMIKNGFPCNYTTDFVNYRGKNTRGLKVGILGLGHMGSMIAEKCASLGMEVSYWSIESKSSLYGLKSIVKIFAESDVVIPFFASNNKTTKLITDQLIHSMKKDAIFVSMICHDYNHELLLEMVARGQLGGYGFEDDTEKNFASYDGM